MGAAGHPPFPQGRWPCVPNLAHLSCFCDLAKEWHGTEWDLSYLHPLCPSVTSQLFSGSFAPGPPPEPSASLLATLPYLPSSVPVYPFLHLSPSLHQDPPRKAVFKLQFVQKCRMPVHLGKARWHLPASLTCGVLRSAVRPLPGPPCTHLHVPQMLLPPLSPGPGSPPSIVPTDSRQVDGATSL